MATHFWQSALSFGRLPTAVECLQTRVIIPFLFYDAQKKAFRLSDIRLANLTPSLLLDCVDSLFPACCFDELCSS